MTVKKIGDQWAVIKSNGKPGKGRFNSKAAAEKSQARGKALAKQFGFTKGGGQKSPSNPKPSSSSGNPNNNNGRKNGGAKKDNRTTRLLRTGMTLATDPMVAGAMITPMVIIDEAMSNDGRVPGATLTERLFRSMTRRYTGFDFVDGTFDFRNRAGTTYTGLAGGFLGREAERISGIRQARTTFLNRGTKKSAAIVATQLPAFLQAAAFAREGFQGGGLARGARNWFAQRVINSSGIDMLGRGQAGAFTPVFRKADFAVGTGLGAFGVIVHRAAQEGNFNRMIDPSRMLPVGV